MDKSSRAYCRGGEGDPHASHPTQGTGIWMSSPFSSWQPWTRVAEPIAGEAKEAGQVMD